MNLDEDTVELVELAINIGAIDYAPFENTLVITYDDLQAFATALLKEVHAGNEAVGMKMASEDYAKTDGRVHFVWWAEVPYGSKLYLSPPTQEVEALKAKLEIAESLIDFELRTELEDRYKAIDNTDESLQEPNTRSE